MARLSIDIPTNLEKIEQKTDTLRRKSTGNSSIQIKEPNYLRASKGSCHDFCKYGIKPVFPVKPWRPVGRTPDKNVNISLHGSPGNDHHRGKKALTSPKLMPVLSRHQLINGLLKQKTCQTADTFSHRPTPKQPRPTLLTSSINKRESANVAGKRVKVSKKSSSPPLNSSSSPQSSPIPTQKSKASNSLQKKVSQLEIKNKTSCYENVPEKIIHVIEPSEDEKRNKGHVQESNNCTAILNPGAEKNTKKANRGARVNIIPDESDSSPQKLKFRRGKVLVIENGNAMGSIERCLRRSSVSEEKVNHHKKNESIGCVLRNQAVKSENTDSVLMNVVIEERASNLVKMRKTKVEALVGAFESVISNTQYP